MQSLETLLVEKRDIATAEKELARIIQDHKGTAFLDRVYWEAKFLEYKMIANFPGALTELRELAEKNPARTQPLDRLADYYEKHSKYQEAAEEYL